MGRSTFEISVGDAAIDSGVEHGAVLVSFTDAVMQGDSDEIEGARHTLSSALGDDAVGDTAAVIMMFNIVDRIADATGIPIDEGAGHSVRYQLGDQLGMNDLSPEERAR